MAEEPSLAPAPTPFVPTARLDQRERNRLQAHIGNAKEQDAKFITNKDGVTEVLTNEEVKSSATVLFKDCSNSEFVVEALTTKLLISGCNNCRFTLNGKIVTSILEIWNCESSFVTINTKVLTLQVDACKAASFQFATKEDFNSLVWAGTDDLIVSFNDNEERVETGFDKMKELYTTKFKSMEDQTLNKEIDQFVVHFVGGKLITEQVVRLKNGFPTTEREAKEFDSRQEEAVKKLAEAAGITIRPKKEAKIARNGPCPCKSGKKYKKCCALKPV